MDPDFDDFAIKRKDSRKVFSLKKNQYKQRKDEFTQQRGAHINLKGKETEDNVEYYDEESDDSVVIREKRTLHQPKMEIIEKKPMMILIENLE